MIFNNFFSIDRDKFYFTLSQGAAAILGIFLGKMFALNISPEVFGEYNLQFGVVSFIVSLLIQPFIQFFKKDYQLIFETLALRKIIFVILGLSSLSIFLGYSIFFYSGFKVDFFVIIILFFYFNFYILENLLNGYLNVNSFFYLLSKSIVLKPLISLIIVLFLAQLIQFKFEDPSIIWLIYLGGMIASLFFLMNTIKKYKSSFKANNQLNFLFRSFQAFGVPLIFLAFWNWINSFFDRFVIDYFFSKELVGIYSVNYGLGSKFFLLLSPIALGLITPISYSRLSLKDKMSKMKIVLISYASISIILLALIFFFKNKLGSLFLSDSYSSGFFILPIISLAFFFLTFSYFFETIFYAEGKTKYILFVSIISSIINIISLIFLVPRFGLLGAAISTLIAFFLYFIINYCFFKRLINSYKC